MVKVVAARKVAAEHGGYWALSRHPGASWMVVEAMGMSWDAHMFDKWSVHAPCMDHGRYKSPATHVDFLGPPIRK